VGPKTFCRVFVSRHSGENLAKNEGRAMNCAAANNDCRAFRSRQDQRGARSERNDLRVRFLPTGFAARTTFWFFDIVAVMVAGINGSWP
jgi:hypothetical protein